MNSRKFKQTVHLKKRWSWNLQIVLITISQMAFCDLRNLFLEAWKLAQMYHLSWVFRVAWGEFIQTVYMAKGVEMW